MLKILGGEIEIENRCYSTNWKISGAACPLFNGFGGNFTPRWKVEQEMLLNGCKLVLLNDERSCRLMNNSEGIYINPCPHKLDEKIAIVRAFGLHTAPYGMAIIAQNPLWLLLRANLMSCYVFYVEAGEKSRLLMAWR